VSVSASATAPNGLEIMRDAKKAKKMVFIPATPSLLVYFTSVVPAENRTLRQ
jgi:hypothetical protein